MVERLIRRSPEHLVCVEYSVTCSGCDSSITDSVQDANEKDAITNLTTICVGTHYTIHRMNNSTCSGELSITTKTTYF